MENKKKNRYPDKLPYDHNRVLLNALTNGTNSDYINASTVMDHDPRNPAYIVTQVDCKRIIILSMVTPISNVQALGFCTFRVFISFNVFRTISVFIMFGVLQ